VRLSSEDYELFLREIEEDKELRANINLFKGNRVSAWRSIRICSGSICRRLLRFHSTLTSADPAGLARRQQSDLASVTDDGEPPEEDFPEVSLDELMDEMALEDPDAAPDMDEDTTSVMGDVTGPA